MSKITREVYEQQLKQFIKENNRFPSPTQEPLFYNNLIAVFGSVENALQSIEMSKDDVHIRKRGANNRKIKEEELFEQARKFYELEGRNPKSTEFSNRQTIFRNFETWNNFLIKAGLEEGELDVKGVRMLKKCKFVPHNPYSVEIGATPVYECSNCSWGTQLEGTPQEHEFNYCPKCGKEVDYD